MPPQAVQLDLSSPARQLQLPQMMCWLQKHGRNLQQLQLSSSTPLGQTSRRALLHCLQRGAATHAASSSSSSVNGSSQQGHLSLQQLALQMDLDVVDLAYLAEHLRQVAPQLQTLKLQPLKPSLSDLQLLVLACILGNLVGTEAAGELCKLHGICKPLQGVTAVLQSWSLHSVHAPEHAWHCVCVY